MKKKQKGPAVVLFCGNWEHREGVAAVLSHEGFDLDRCHLIAIPGGIAAAIRGETLNFTFNCLRDYRIAYGPEIRVILVATPPCSICHSHGAQSLIRQTQLMMALAEAIRREFGHRMAVLTSTTYII